jgi:hypothetical protein
LAEQVGELVAEVAQLAVGEVAFVVFAEPADGDFVAQGAVGVAVYGFVGDV